MKTLWRSLAFRLKGHNATLKLLFREPPPAIHWHKVEMLLAVCGVEIWRGPGDGTYLELNGIRTEIHTPEEEVPTPTIRRTRNFLKQAGVTPSDIWLFLERA
jgi:hypothetical protein